jgi:hypothetical protein
MRGGNEMTDLTPENDEREKDANRGPRKSLADDLILAEFAELSRTRGLQKDKASEELRKEPAGVEDQERDP